MEKQCPGTGCDRVQHLSDFEPDQAFAVRVKAWLRREESGTGARGKGTAAEVLLDSDGDESD
jgi:hypothetical protein